MASRSIFVFTILLSLVLVSCLPSGSSNGAEWMINRACRRTNDFGFCVSTLESNIQPGTVADPKALTNFLAKQALSKVDEGTAYIEKVFYYEQDLVVKQYLALCLDDYAKARQKLERIEGTLATSNGNYKKVRRLMNGVARHAADCQEAFERKKLRSAVNYRPPRPCPLSQQNKSIRLMGKAASGLLALRW